MFYIMQMSSDNYQNLPHVYLREGQRLEVYESRNIWGRKKTTYRVVQDSDSAYGIWVLIILMLLAVAGFVFFDPFWHWHCAVGRYRTGVAQNL